MATISFLLIVLTLAAMAMGARTESVLGNVRPMFTLDNQNNKQGKGAVVQTQAVTVTPTADSKVSYHNGPLMTGTGGLKVHIIWYGSFTLAQRQFISDFFASLASPPAKTGPHTAWGSWWSTIHSSYVDKRNATVAASVQLGLQLSDRKYSLGKSLNRTDIRGLVLSALRQKKLPWPGSSARNRLYVVLTSADVAVERFCMSSCAYHDYTFPTRASKYHMLPYAWVGNAATQCPGQCAWPYAVPEYGPPGPPLKAPSGDVGADGMLINLGAVLAGAATNPFGTGYYQGDPAAPLEAATACNGIFGPGAYPGYPGKLIVDAKTKASFNVYGANGREFLVPGLWDPRTSSCVTP